MRSTVLGVIGLARQRRRLDRHALHGHNSIHHDARQDLPDAQLRASWLVLGAVP